MSDESLRGRERAEQTHLDPLLGDLVERERERAGLPRQSAARTHFAGELATALAALHHRYGRVRVTLERESERRQLGHSEGARRKYLEGILEATERDRVQRAARPLTEPRDLPGFPVLLREPRYNHYLEVARLSDPQVAHDGRGFNALISGIPVSELLPRRLRAADSIRERSRIEEVLLLAKGILALSTSRLDFWTVRVRGEHAGPPAIYQAVLSPPIGTTVPAPPAEPTMIVGDSVWNTGTRTATAHDSRLLRWSGMNWYRIDEWAFDEMVRRHMLLPTPEGRTP